MTVSLSSELHQPPAVRHEALQIEGKVLSADASLESPAFEFLAIGKECKPEINAVLIGSTNRFLAEGPHIAELREDLPAPTSPPASDWSGGPVF